MQGDVVPVAEIVFIGLYQLEFLLWIVYECAQFLFLLLTECVAEYLVNLSLDIARGILEDMQEGLVLAVYVGKEMLCALGKVEYGGEVYDLRRG